MRKMEIQIQLYDPLERLPFEGQAVVAVYGGDIMSGIYENGHLRLADSRKVLIMDFERADYWAKAQQINDEIRFNI